MVFNSHCVHVLLTKVALALEGLRKAPPPPPSVTYPLSSSLTVDLSNKNLLRNMATVHVALIWPREIIRRAQRSKDDPLLQIHTVLLGQPKKKRKKEKSLWNVIFPYPLYYACRVFVWCAVSVIISPVWVNYHPWQYQSSRRGYYCRFSLRWQEHL